VTAAAPLASPAPTPLASALPEETEIYTRAHRLHFDEGNPAAALGAWDDYLARFPHGQFAPEARYNRAIDLLKMKRYPEARAALQPFAEGAYGGYHQDAARELLESNPELRLSK
jgi:TolA-binding protein